MPTHGRPNVAYTGHPDWAIEREGRYTFRSEPISDDRLRALAAALASLTAAPPAAVPADRPTSTLVGSACLTTETHEPAGPR